MLPKNNFKGEDCLKKLACVIFELENDESLADLDEKLNKYFEGETFYTYSKSGALVKPARKSKEACWKQKARDILNKLGLTPHVMGYNMIIHMLEPLSESTGKTDLGYLKRSYDHTAEAMGKTRVGVERAVRLAIDKICEYNTNEELEELLGIPVNSNMKITNSTFIALLAEVVF